MRTHPVLAVVYFALRLLVITGVVLNLLEKDYESAFVFVRDNDEIPAVPPWAIKLVLEKEDI